MIARETIENSKEYKNPSDGGRKSKEEDYSSSISATPSIKKNNGSDGDRKSEASSNRSAPPQNDTEKANASKEGVSSMLEEAKRITSVARSSLQSSLNHYPEALVHAASYLHSVGYHDMGDKAQQFAASARQAIQVVAEEDLDQLGARVSSFARQRPAVVVGAALAGGVLLGRFIKASSKSVSERSVAAQ